MLRLDPKKKLFPIPRPEVPMMKAFAGIYVCTALLDPRKISLWR